VCSSDLIRTAIREKRQSGKNITCKIDGFCGSAAVGIAAACESTSIPASAWFMIHDPAVFAYGYFMAEDFTKGLNMLVKIKQGIVAAYAAKTGKDKQELSDLMAAETWYTGEEAVANGFCDEVMFEDEAAADKPPTPENAAAFDVSMYQNAPAALLSRYNPQNSGLSYTAPTIAPQNTKKGGTSIMAISTVAELRAEYPELSAQIAEEATNTERKRIMDIENIALPGFDEVTNAAKFEKPVTAAEVAMNIIALQKKQGGEYIRNRTEDVTNSGANGVVASGNEGGSSDTNPFDAAIDSVLPVTK